jgi:hypothetical protein
MGVYPPPPALSLNPGVPTFKRSDVEIEAHLRSGDPDRVGTFRKSFTCNIYEPPRKCCIQETYAPTKPCRCNTYKKPGVGSASFPRCPLLPTHRPLSESVLLQRPARRPPRQGPPLMQKHYSAISSAVLPSPSVSACSSASPCSGAAGCARSAFALQLSAVCHPERREGSAFEKQNHDL